jgi:transcriptional regulator with XRE-family HTH domain
MENFGDRLRTIREKKGLSKEKMAEYLGISTKTLYRYEKNKAEPTISMIEKMAHVLDVPFYELLNYFFTPQNIDKKVQKVTANANHIKGVSHSNIAIGEKVSIKSSSVGDISNSEDKLLENYRDLPKELKELYFYKIKADAIEHRLRRGE